MAALAMDDDRCVFAEIAQQMRFDFVFFLLGVIPRHLTAAVAP